MLAPAASGVSSGRSALASPAGPAASSAPQQHASAAGRTRPGGAPGRRTQRRTLLQELLGLLEQPLLLLALLPLTPLLLLALRPGLVRACAVTRMSRRAVCRCERPSCEAVHAPLPSDASSSTLSRLCFLCLPMRPHGDAAEQRPTGSALRARRPARGAQARLRVSAAELGATDTPTPPAVLAQAKLCSFTCGYDCSFTGGLATQSHFGLALKFMWVPTGQGQDHQGRPELVQAPIALREARLLRRPAKQGRSACLVIVEAAMRLQLEELMTM
jgi:hypothetical protein